MSLRDQVRRIKDEVLRVLTEVREVREGFVELLEASWPRPLQRRLSEGRRPLAEFRKLLRERLAGRRLEGEAEEEGAGS